MAYLQKGQANYFGFMPATSPQGGASLGHYIVSSSEAGAISIGDVCVGTTIGTVKIAPSGGLSTGFIGVAASPLAAGGGSTGATLTVNSSQMVILYNDPIQVYVGCETTSSIMGGPLKTGFGVAVATTGCVGSTGTRTGGQSVMAISATLTSTSAVLPFKLLGLHPIEGGVYSTVAFATAGATTEVRRWLVQANLTQLAPGFIVVTT